MFSREELDCLTDILSDRQIVAKYNIPLTTFWRIRKQLEVRSYHEKFGSSNAITEGWVTFFDEITCPEKAYFLGLLATDGCIKTVKNRGPVECVLHLHEDDISVLQFFKNFANLPGSIRPTHKRDSPNQMGISLVSRHLCESLVAWGITPKKSRTLEILRPIPHQFEADFIRGCWDGDGWVGPSQYTLTSASINFIHQVQDIIHRNTGCLLKVDDRSARNAWELRGTRAMKEAIRWIYSNTEPALERKVIQVSRYWSN